MTVARLMIAAGLLAGAALGIASYTFVYARGPSYLRDNPSACANCHVMEEHYAAWLRSSHRDHATCNDCHTSPGTVSKYLDKGSNGVRHSFAFTVGELPLPLRITPANARVTEQACRKCHGEIAAAMDPQTHGAPAPAGGDEASCVRCHTTVGHWVH
jgi:cytochrome c nitrite reductase small subunit